MHSCQLATTAPAHIALPVHFAHTPRHGAVTDKLKEYFLWLFYYNYFNFKKENEILSESLKEKKLH